MFEFLKKLLGKKEERPEQSKEDKDILGQWPKLKSQIRESAGLKLEPYEKKAALLIHVLEQQARALKEVDLSDRKIGGKISSCASGACPVPGLMGSPDRIIEQINENKERYVVALMAFIAWLKGWQTKISKSDHKLCYEFEARLVSFGQKTQKNFFILTEMIGKEAEQVVSSLRKLKELNELVNAKINETKIHALAQIDSSLIYLNKLKEKIKILEEEEEKAVEEVERLEEEIAATAQYLARAKRCNEVEQLNQARAEKKSAQNKLEAQESAIRGLFLVYQKGLKKVLYGMPSSRSLELYLDSPCLALELDKELKVMSMFKQLKEDLEARKFSLKEKLRTSILNQIKNLDLKQVQGLRQKLLEAKRLLKELEEKEKALLETDKIKEIEKKKNEIKTKYVELEEKLTKKEKQVKYKEEARQQFAQKEQEIESEIKRLIS